MKYIEKRYGPILRMLERRDMALEKYSYSFEAFMELAAASNHDWMRDQHWRIRVNPSLKNYKYLEKYDNCGRLYSKKLIVNILKISALKDRFFIIAHLVQMNTILLSSKSLPMKIKGITTFTVCFIKK